MSDAPSRKTRKGRSSSLHLPKRSDPIPIPPPHQFPPPIIPLQHLPSQATHPTAPSREHDEWLRDMVPLDWDKSEKLSGRSSAAAISLHHWEISSSPSSEVSPIILPWHPRDITTIVHGLLPPHHASFPLTSDSLTTPTYKTPGFEHPKPSFTGYPGLSTRTRSRPTQANSWVMPSFLPFGI